MFRLTRQQVREVDRIAIERYGIPGIVLMENAARGAADVAMGMLRGIQLPRVLVVCGGGNNGGDGYALARHLDLRGYRVDIVELGDVERLPPDAQINRAIMLRIASINRLKSITAAETGGAYDLVVDAIFGTGLTRPPNDASRDAIEAINQLRSPTLSIDLPSGLDCDSGLPLGDACVQATTTVTFVAEKSGFANPQSRPFTGEVIVTDIGAPTQILREVLRGT